MAKKMISALKEIVGENVVLEEKRGKIRSALMNMNRLEIFQFLCRVPGSSIFALAQEFKYSKSTIKWHLEKLKDGNYISESYNGNRVYYFPKGMIDNQYVKVLSTLNEDLPMRLYWRLLKDQGLMQKDLCHRLKVGLQPLRLALKKLRNHNLVLEVIDGRNRRYYPTDELYNIATKSRRKMIQFKTNLIKKLEAELLNPKVHITKSGERAIEIDIGSSKNYIFIPSDIAASILSYYADRLGKVK